MILEEGGSSITRYILPKFSGNATSIFKKDSTPFFFYLPMHTARKGLSRTFRVRGLSALPVPRCLSVRLGAV